MSYSPTPYTDKERDEEYSDTVRSLSGYDLDQVVRQGEDSYCIYSRLDDAFHTMEAFDVAFLENYAMVHNKELWLQAHKVHTELYNLYQMLGSKFYEMVPEGTNDE